MVNTAERAERTYTMAGFPPFMRPPHPVPASHMRLIGLVGIATLLGAYDLQIFGLAAKQILAEFQLTENATGPTIALFRLGVFGALLLCLLADVIGRRRLLLFTILGMALSTAGTAFAPDYETFVVMQVLVRIFGYTEDMLCIVVIAEEVEERTFGYTEDMLCIVVIAEEVEERTRGWSIGALGTLGTLGAGVAVAMFALVNLLPFGWRAIFVLGAVPLFLLAWMRRGLPETRRFASAAAAGARPANPLDAWRPMIGLLRAYPARLGLLMLAVAPLALGMAPSLALMPTFLQSEHAFSPAMISGVLIGTGLVGLTASMWIGKLSDRTGRRPTLLVGIVLTTIGMAGIYYVDTLWLLVAAILIGVFGQVAVGIQVDAYSAELFPTAYRATSSAMRFMAGIMGGAIGLLLQGAVLAPWIGFGPAVLMLLIPAPLALIGIYFLPETAGRRLEDISQEPGRA